MIPPEIIVSLSSVIPESGTSFRVISSHGLSGGCINHVSRVETTAGTYCLKFNSNLEYPGMFEAEAQGLNHLSEARAIRIPGVVGTGEGGGYSFILLEFIESARRRQDFMERFGQQLACLHRQSHPFFGFDQDNYMGSLPQQNRIHDTYPDFFREERLEPQVRLAAGKGYLTSRELSAFNRLFGVLDSILPENKPALVHGDLWSGNFMVDDRGEPCLIDPAAHYGSREAEIAMTTLFGGFDPDFYHAYQEEWPMEPGWRERLCIYNLYPLLIHVNLFGSGYLDGIRETLKNF